MIGIPKKYEVNQKIDVKNFINKVLKATDKKRLKETLKEVKLIYQIQGEEMPSIITEECNCQVILYLDVEINSIKDAVFVASIMQNQIKSLCVLRLFDKNNQQYHFAEKRLNMQDANNTVIENTVITKEVSIHFDDGILEAFKEYLSFSNILLKDNKVVFYREVMTKAYIISEVNLQLERDKFLESKLWYNSRKVKELLEALKELEKLKLSVKKSKSIKEKVSINNKIKEVNVKIEREL